MNHCYATFLTVVVFVLFGTATVSAQTTTCSKPNPDLSNPSPPLKICLEEMNGGNACPGDIIMIDPEDDLFLPQGEQFAWYITQSAIIAQQLGNPAPIGVDPNSQLFPANNPNFTYIGSSGISPQADQGKVDTCPKLMGLLVDACGTGAIESRNEFAIMATGSGFVASSLRFDFDDINNLPGGNENNDIQTGANACGLQQPEASLIASIKSNVCRDANIIPIGPEEYVPANGLALLFTSSGVQTNYNFDALCKCDKTIYILQSACTRTAGAFSNHTSFGLRTYALGVNNCFSTIEYYPDSLLLTGDGTIVYYNEKQQLVNANATCSAPPLQRIPQPVILADTEPFQYFVPYDACHNAPYYIIGVLAGLDIECTSYDKASLTRVFRFEVECTDIIAEVAETCEGGDAIRLSDLVNVPVDFITDINLNLINTNYAHEPTEAGSYKYTLYLKSSGNTCYSPVDVVVEVAAAVETELETATICANEMTFDLHELLLHPADATMGAWEYHGVAIAPEITLADYANSAILEFTFVPMEGACIEASTTSLEILPETAVLCNPTDDGVDLALTMVAENSNPPIYTSMQLELVIKNEGNLAATNIIVEVPKPDGIVYSGGNEWTATQGIFTFYQDQTWTIAELAAGTSASLQLNYFVLTSSPFTVFAQVINATETDSDSTPKNGICCTPNEDDEAVFVFNAIENLAVIPSARLAQANAVALYPNPTSSELYLEYNLTEEESIQYQLFDSRGQLYHISPFVLKQKGQDRIKVQESVIASLPKGIYFCRLQIGEQGIVKRFVVLH